MKQTNDILFDIMPGVQGDIGVITLNRPSALNALNHVMIQALQHHLDLWEQMASIKAVIVKAVPGRAFCAGGDIRNVYVAGQQSAPSVPLFFWDEYRLNRKIFHFSKPYIALLDGITMGGGVGISIHGSHRVATDNILFAMPETGIGFFPDVGGSYFLSRLRALGTYLGLTGARLKIDDLLTTHLVDHHVDSNNLDSIIERLASTPFSENAKQSVSDILNQYSKPHSASELSNLQTQIEHCFGQTTVETIIENLKNDNSAWAEKTLNLLSSKSPTSLKISLQQLQNGANKDFDTCMQMEYRMVNHFLAGHDFFEGVRALIIDKDNQAKWQPDSLSSVTDTMVNAYFSPIKIPELSFEPSPAEVI